MKKCEKFISGGATNLTAGKFAIVLCGDLWLRRNDHPRTNSLQAVDDYLFGPLQAGSDNTLAIDRRA
jgi:hypothetical protein